MVNNERGWASNRSHVQLCIIETLGSSKCNYRLTNLYYAVNFYTLFIQFTWKIDDEIMKTEYNKSNGLILEPKENYDNKTISCRAVNSVQSPPARQVRMVYWHKPKVYLESVWAGDCTHLGLQCKWVTDNPTVSSTIFVNSEQIDVNDANFNNGSTWMSFSLTEIGRSTSESVSVTCAVENQVGSVNNTIHVDACKYDCL